jgi:predicted metalloenzyme YecM
MNREDIVSEVAKVWDRRAMEDELTHASIKIMAQHVEIEQLREANEMMLTDIRRTDVDMLAFKAEIERLRKMLWEVNEQCPEHVPVSLLNQIRAALKGK